MASSGRRPEHMAPPEVFYNQDEAKKYTQNSRMIEIQSQMSERAVELLNLPEGQTCFLLDVGISALQWLCNADKKSHSPPKRLHTFFSTLYSSLSRGARAIFQFYPENSEQLELITSQAMRAGFSGGMVVDYPNSSKAKKFFLCLFAGVSGVLPKGLGSEATGRNVPDQVQFSGQRTRFKNMKGRSVKKGKDWILDKKERRRRQGREVRADTKYTGRNRKPHF
ncbi:hypothetical protein CRUP_037501 [Coryphaenoides rupestris]|nr:hypothetical protein CRUP_037501 [Coryphaenoides rupestris]